MEAYSERPLGKFLCKTILMLVAITFIITYLIRPYRMSGNSMYPSVRDGDLCMIYLPEECHINDVVYYEDANGSMKLGRIVAIGGQTIDFSREDRTYSVNGYQAVEENPYETYASETGFVTYPLELQENEYFILNDFRADTSDSREYGPITKTQVKGKVLFLLRRRGF